MIPQLCNRFMLLWVFRFSCVMCGWMRSAFLLCSHGSMNLTNQHTSLWGSGKLWSSLILSTITAAQAHGCKWYMSLTDAVAPCLLVHWQATTTYRSKQWHSTGLCLQAHHCTRSHAKKIRKGGKSFAADFIRRYKRKKRANKLPIYIQCPLLIKTGTSKTAEKTTARKKTWRAQMSPKSLSLFVWSPCTSRRVQRMKWRKLWIFSLCWRLRSIWIGTILLWEARTWV